MEIDGCRKAFEEWWCKQHGFFTPDISRGQHGEYNWCRTHDAWSAWCARVPEREAQLKPVECSHTWPGKRTGSICAECFQHSVVNADPLREIEMALHYPECWDTMAYPTIFNALHELAGCVGCSECKDAGMNPDADQRPIVRELGHDDLVAIRLAESCIRDLGAGLGGWSWEEVADDLSSLLDRIEEKGRRGSDE